MCRNDRVNLTRSRICYDSGRVNWKKNWLEIGFWISISGNRILYDRVWATDEKLNLSETTDELWMNAYVVSENGSTFERFLLSQMVIHSNDSNAIDIVTGFYRYYWGVCYLTQSYLWMLWIGVYIRSKIRFCNLIN